MSSVAYTPEEIFLVLSVAGLWPTLALNGLAVAFVMAVVVAGSAGSAVRLPVRRRRLRGGHEEPRTERGAHRGQRLLVDYVLTVAVSISSAASNIGSAVPFVAQHKVWFAIVAIVVLTAMNLRGIREWDWRSRSRPMRSSSGWS